MNTGLYLTSSMHTSLARWEPDWFPASFFGLPGQPAPTPYYMKPLSTRSALPLLETPGAIIDRSSLTVGDNSVLVYYISNDVDFSTATQAVIVVHGVNRDANKAFASMQGAVETANKNETIIMAVRTIYCFVKRPTLIAAYSLFFSMETIRVRFQSRRG